MFYNLLLIGAGGFLGSIARYLLTHLAMIYMPASFPFGTFLVNIIGCFGIGLVMGITFTHGMSTKTKLILATGFCGGFTTFSTYSLEIYELWEKGALTTGLLYAIASLVLGLAAIGLGFWITAQST